MIDNAQNNTLVIEPIFEGTDSLMKPKRQIEKLLLTPKETAKALSICQKTVYNLTKMGEIPVVRCGPHGRLVRYCVADLKAWIEGKKIFEHS